MKAFKDTAEEMNGSITTLKKCCELCGKRLKLYQSNYDRPYKFVFINITQEPAKHYFCSKKCKNEWIFNPNNHQITELKTPI
ncbi:MAG: hypothetical protein HWN80_07590 [Candidatus Lokiarchaeota archaeon]|nr:hypothetical protein [Candidatus Lokiarchaeota archaeon]